jgi:hypothetical protein
MSALVEKRAWGPLHRGYELVLGIEPLFVQQSMAVCEGAARYPYVHSRDLGKMMVEEV